MEGERADTLGDTMLKGMRHYRGGSTGVKEIRLSNYSGNRGEDLLTSGDRDKFFNFNPSLNPATTSGAERYQGRKDSLAPSDGISVRAPSDTNLSGLRIAPMTSTGFIQLIDKTIKRLNESPLQINRPSQKNDGDKFSNACIEELSGRSQHVFTHSNNRNDNFQHDEIHDKSAKINSKTSHGGSLQLGQTPSKYQGYLHKILERKAEIPGTTIPQTMRGYPRHKEAMDGIRRILDKKYSLALHFGSSTENNIKDNTLEGTKEANATTGTLASNIGRRSQSLSKIKRLDLAFCKVAEDTSRQKQSTKRETPRNHKSSRHNNKSNKKAKFKQKSNQASHSKMEFGQSMEISVEKLLEENAAIKLKLWKRENECKELRQKLKNMEQRYSRISEKVKSINKDLPTSRQASISVSKSKTIERKPEESTSREKLMSKLQRESQFLQHLNRQDAIPLTKKLRIPNSIFKNILHNVPEPTPRGLESQDTFRELPTPLPTSRHVPSLRLEAPDLTQYEQIKERQMPKTTRPTTSFSKQQR